jgi:hypothetical protein
MPGLVKGLIGGNLAQETVAKILVTNFVGPLVKHRMSFVQNRQRAISLF